MVNVFRVCEADERLTDAFRRLIPQLSAAMSVPTEEALHRMVASPSVALFCAEEEAQIVGMLSLAWYEVPSGCHAWIEDVVVDAAQRGRGTGDALVRAVLDHAAHLGVDKVSLTSHASRTAAHALYRKTGFEVYDTTLFRLKLQE